MDQAAALTSLNQYRSQYPQYANRSDAELSSALAKKHANMDAAGLTKYRAQYPQYANRSDAELSSALSKKYATMATAIAQPQRTTPDYMSQILDEGGADPATRQRLLNTGVTPGTASEWAAAHIQMNKTRGREVGQREQEAIFDLYKRQSGRQDLSSRNVAAERHQLERESRTETLGGRVHNTGLAMMRNFATTGANVVGKFAPETALRMEDESQALYNPHTPGGFDSGLAGNMIAEIGKLTTFAKTGPAGMAAIYGGQGFGGQRIEAARLRQQGQEVSGVGEFGTAVGVGAAEAASGFIGGKIFQAMGRTMHAASPTIKGLLSQGKATAVKQLLGQSLQLSGHMLAEGTEEAVTQIITNKIRQGVNPDVALMDGVKEAFAMGAILSPFGAVGMGTTGKSQAEMDMAIEQANLNPNITVRAKRNFIDRLLNPKKPGAQDVLDAPLSDLTGAETDPAKTEHIKVYGEGVAEGDVSDTQFTGAATDESLGQSMLTPSMEANKVERRKRPRSPDAVRAHPFFREGELQRVKRELRQERKLARTDSLTGLGNKREYDETLKKFTQRSQDNGKPFSVIIFDAANLKAANDVLGHEGADQILKDLGVHLRTGSQRREGDAVVTRQGGDEFAVILPDTNKAGATLVLQKIEDAVGTQTIIPGLSMFLAGDVATFTGKGDFDAALHAADEGVEAKKRLLKEQLGEVTERSEAEALIKKHKAEQARRKAQQTQQVKRDTKQTVDHERKAIQVVERGVAASKKATPLAGSKTKRLVPKTIEDAITPISSRIKDISDRVFGGLMNMEFNTGVMRERVKKQLREPANRVQAALKKIDGMDEFKILILNQEFDKAEQLLKRADPEVVEDFRRMNATLKMLLDMQRSAGVTIGDVPNYWPRYIRNYKAFKSMHGTETGRFDAAFNTARALLGKRVLTAAQKVEIANGVIQGYGPRRVGKSGSPSTRARTISKISTELIESYSDPFDALFRYTDEAIYNANRAGFLGVDKMSGELEDSIGAIVTQEIDAGRLSPKDQDELHDLLTARFMADILTPSRAVQNLKNMTYIATLTQLSSVLNQFTDAAITAADHGVINTIRGAGRAARITAKEKRFIMEDIGVHDHGEEFRDVGRLSKSLDKSLTATQFKRVDRFGKETRINTAYIAFSQAAVNPQGKKYQRLERKYKDVLHSGRFDQAMKDLREGKKTEDIRYLLFLDIIEIQPLTQSQMPKRYLEMPAGRIMYTLQTFQMMQLDHIRRKGLRQLATKGQRTEGLRWLAQYTAYFAAMKFGLEFIRKWMRGQEMTADDIPEIAIESLLSATGFGRYTYTEIGTHPVKATMNQIIPPLSWIDNIWSDLTHLGDGKGSRGLRHVPRIGEILYFHSPLGRGFHLNKEESKKVYRSMLRDIRTQAEDALRSGDMDMTRQLVVIYNERRKQGAGDGRKYPLNVATLRSHYQRLRKKEREDAR